MEALTYLKETFTTCFNAIKWAADIQGRQRKTLIADLQKICDNCQTALGTVVKRLARVKRAYANPDKLADELRKFAADQTTRNAFKPAHLCGEIFQLMQNIQNNLHPLKYTINIKKIDDLKKQFQAYGNYDYQIFRAYDDLTADLDTVAIQIQDPQFDRLERAQYARHAIADFEAELRSIIALVEKMQREIASGI